MSIITAAQSITVTHTERRKYGRMTHLQYGPPVTAAPRDGPGPCTEMGDKPVT